MPKAKPSKRPAFSVHTCPHCGRKTRGPAHFRHERACRRQLRRRMMATARRRPTVSRRVRTGRGGQPLGQFFEQLRRLVQQEIQRQLGVAA